MVGAHETSLPARTMQQNRRPRLGSRGGQARLGDRRQRVLSVRDVEGGICRKLLLLAFSSIWCQIHPQFPQIPIISPASKTALLILLLFSENS